MNIKHIIPVAALASLSLASCGNDDDKNTNANTENISEGSVDAVLPEYSYKRLEGTIAGQPVVMHLQKEGNHYNSMYSYKKQGKWISLNYTADTVQKDLMVFHEFAPNTIDANGDTKPARLEGKYADGAFTGKWISGDGSKQYDFVLKDTYPEGSFKFAAAGLKDSVIAFANKAESPVGRISKYFPVAQKGADAEWLNNKLRAILYVDKYGNVPLEDAVKKDFATYIANYKSETASQENEEFVAMLNYESMQEVGVRYNENNFVVLESLSYDYEGGAHGNYGSAIYCLDVKNKKQLKLSDIVSADSVQLKALVEKNFRQQTGLTTGQPLTEYLFENKLPANDNFYFTNQGIGFVYNPYEVAAYAFGQINVFVPYSDLKPYLNPDFAQRLQIK